MRDRYVPCTECGKRAMWRHGVDAKCAPCYTGVIYDTMMRVFGCAPNTAVQAILDRLSEQDASTCDHCVQLKCLARGNPRNANGVCLLTE